METSNIFITLFYHFRSRRNSTGSSEASSGGDSGRSSPMVEGGRRRLWEEYSDNEEYSDDDDEEGGSQRRRSRVASTRTHQWGTNPNQEILDPADVTENMLANVSYRVSDKVYSQSGTTCHQCRQKTLDVKTVCRSGNCAGIRGGNELPATNFL